MAVIKVTLDKNATECACSVDWFLRSQDESEQHSYPVISTFKPIINGEAVFDCLYEKISQAKHSIDIAIWGFQPSMFFRRDGKSLCIGDLLIKKALYDNVKIRLLVWDMPLHLQTLIEGNQGNIEVSGMVRKNKVEGVTQEQLDYDRYWYYAIQGKLSQYIKLQYMGQDYLYANRVAQEDLLLAFSNSNKLANLIYRGRSVSLFQDWTDPESPFTTDLIQMVSLSHHQKSVLIDYDKPDLAVGFVLEHNMIDNYWDTSDHFYDEQQTQWKLESVLPANKRNHSTPYQDVSSIVTGQVLWDLNRNFSQSWLREDLFGSIKNLWTNILHHESNESVQQARSAYLPNPKLGENGEILMAQVLRTYDMPDVEDIRKMYLKNITQVTSYIYTENQYVRYPPLVKAFIAHWEKLRQHREDSQPIHWFIVTNSSDEGVESGSHNADIMFKLLGRQDVMPNVGRTDLPPEQLSQTKTEQDKALFQDLSETIGIRTHICTLAPQDKHHPGQYFNDLKHETYVHSKVTIIDDVFCFIGSANLNYRSMKGDTELGIITECKKVNQKLRQDLWALHTGKPVGSAENPVDMSDYQTASQAFKRWGELLNENIGTTITYYALREFYRPNTDKSKKD